jgi:glutathione synthase
MKIYHPASNHTRMNNLVREDSSKEPIRNDALTKAAQTADRLGILRSDYMLHRHNDSSPYTIHQVELNTIASSFAGLASQVAKLHTHLIERHTTNATPSALNDSDTGLNNNALDQFLLDNQKAVLTEDQAGSPSESKSTHGNTGVPTNPTLERLPFAMNLAVQRYCRRFNIVSNYGILFVVQNGETNTVDQRMLEFQLWDTYRIPVIRLSLSQIYKQVQRNESTGAITVQCDSDSHPIEIALVYFRAGYAPTDYPDGYENGIEWYAREVLETSRATKCPNLGYHLAGTKKVQQELSRPGVLEKYFPDEPIVVEQMRLAFAELYSLGDDVNDTDMNAIRDVFFNSNYDRYVLKPQREGGGYNFYGEQLFQKLRNNVIMLDDILTSKGVRTQRLHLSKALGEYILMERLFPPQQMAILLRSGKVEGTGFTISELGCFGTILVAGDDLDIATDNQTTNDDKEPAKEIHSSNVVHNDYAGFLLRTKFSNVDEGGVASGFATLSSPYLC